MEKIKFKGISIIDDRIVLFCKSSEEAFRIANKIFERGFFYD